MSLSLKQINHTKEGKGKNLLTLLQSASIKELHTLV